MWEQFLLLILSIVYFTKTAQHSSFQSPTHNVVTVTIRAETVVHPMKRTNPLTIEPSITTVIKFNVSTEISTFFCSDYPSLPPLPTQTGSVYQKLRANN